MPWENSRSLRIRASGFSLLEMLVALTLLAIAAGALSPLALGQIRAHQRGVTLAQMEALYRGIVGDRSAGFYGYIGDMGGLPSSLADLNTPGGQNLYSVDLNYRIGAGYNGPYAPAARDELLDAWNTSFGYSSAAAQITSAGPDRTFSTADDLAFPPQPDAVSGDLTVVVRGVPSGGGSEVNLTSAEADVYVASVTNGTRSETLMTGSGPFVTTNLPVGYTGIRVDGRLAYAGVTVRDVVEIRRGNRTRTIVIEAP